MASAPSAHTLGNRFVELHTAQYSASTYLTVGSLNLRNGREGMIYGEQNARKVVFGALAPVVLVLVSVIETLARAVFSVGVYIYSIANGGDQAQGAQKERNEYLSHLAFSGMFFSGENTANCVMAIYNTVQTMIWPDQVHLSTYDELLPGLVDFNRPSLGDINIRLSSEAPAVPAPAAAPAGGGAAPAAEAPKAEEPKKAEPAPSAPAA